MENSSKNQKDMTYAFLAYWKAEEIYEPTLFEFLSTELYQQIPFLPRRFYFFNTEKRCKKSIDRGIELLLKEGFITQISIEIEPLYTITDKLQSYRFGRKNFELKRKIQDNPMQILLNIENQE